MQRDAPGVAARARENCAMYPSTNVPICHSHPFSCIFSEASGPGYLCRIRTWRPFPHPRHRSIYWNFLYMYNIFSFLSLIFYPHRIYYLRSEKSSGPLSSVPGIIFFIRRSDAAADPVLSSPFHISRHRGCPPPRQIVLAYRAVICQFGRSLCATLTPVE